MKDVSLEPLLNETLLYCAELNTTMDYMCQQSQRHCQRPMPCQLIRKDTPSPITVRRKM